MLRLRARWRKWRSARFLKDHGCRSWAEYNRRYDPDFVHRASYVKNIYTGYEFVHCIDSHTHYAYKMIYDYGPGGYKDGYHEIISWCEEHCEGKYRCDFLRVMWDQWMNDWTVNELGGADYVFFAFKNETDFMNYLLRWAGVSR